MRAETKGAVKNSVSRLVFAALSVLVQVLWILYLLVRLNAYSTWISLGTSVLSFILVLHIYGREMNAGMKMPWIMLILLFPIMGVCLYLFCGHSSATKGMRKRFHATWERLRVYLRKDDPVMEKLKVQDVTAYHQSYYIGHKVGYPLYENTDVVFYKEAADGFHAQIEEMKKAQKFIFMEYHAIEDREAFAEMKAVLFAKAKEGVEVRIVYDDVGSVGFISPEFVKQMKAHGIDCRIFNPMMPVLNIFMNNRDHRKITVIDGRVGFTGGYNLANEYFNITHPYGVWKDSGVRLEGEAVRSLTLIFMEMWNAIRSTDTEYEKYLPDGVFEAKGGGYVQPYADSPLDRERVGENVYMNIIKGATEYVYFITPYLIISDEMKRELGLAAKRGIDARIVTPGIPDKKLVYRLTRSYYAGLIRDGVRIYEYTPGFCHAKQCICDGKIATVGTINLDYRSLYFHFENGVYLYDVPAIKDIREDFEEVFAVSTEVGNNYHTARSPFKRLGQYFLRLFAPLL